MAARLVCHAERFGQGWAKAFIFRVSIIIMARKALPRLFFGERKTGVTDCDLVRLAETS